MTMEGVTSTNFESLKDELTEITAKSLGVPKTSVKLTIKETDRTSDREGGTVINVEISVNEKDDKTNIANAISTGEFTRTMNEEISKSSTLSGAGIEVLSVSTPTVKQNTITGNDFI